MWKRWILNLLTCQLSWTIYLFSPQHLNCCNIAIYGVSPNGTLDDLSVYQKRSLQSPKWGSFDRPPLWTGLTKNPQNKTPFFKDPYNEILINGGGWGRGGGCHELAALELPILSIEQFFNVLINPKLLRLIISTFADKFFKYLVFQSLRWRGGKLQTDSVNP